MSFMQSNVISMKSLKVISFFLCVMLCLTSFLMQAQLAVSSKIDQEVIIIGGGIAGALHAYSAHQDAKKMGKKVRVTICEKNRTVSETPLSNVVFSLTPDEIVSVLPSGSELLKKLQVAFNNPGGLLVHTNLFNNQATTTANIVPSLTPDEILSVVPRGKMLVEKLQAAFNEPGGIRVDDVGNVNNSDPSKNFIQQVEAYSHDLDGYQNRTKTLLELGKMSMDLWQQMYDQADEVLKKILIDSNFNSCREISNSKAPILHDGYRIDLIYGVCDAAQRAAAMKADYESLGYNNCKLLSPSQVIKLDPYLTSFCEKNSIKSNKGEYSWNHSSVALWRPGGCIDTKIFLPKLYEYLRTSMGTFVDAAGVQRDCFQVQYDAHVTRLDCVTDDNKTLITGVRFANGLSKQTDSSCSETLYILCPGEAVGTLDKLDLQEPAYAGFAGVSLLLTIPLPEDKKIDYQALNHCMEVHQEGVVLAWQARYKEGHAFIGVAGTKAFYGDQQPTKDQAFAKDRNLLQLNMINDVLPDLLSIALQKDTRGQKLTQDDIDILEKNGIAQRWAGRRAVVFDGFPTLGKVHHKNGTLVKNAIVTTHLGSGGVSFGPAAVAVSCSAYQEPVTRDPFFHTVLDFAQATRTALP